MLEQLGLCFLNYIVNHVKPIPTLKKMRFIPTTSYLQNSGVCEKLTESITRQSWFIASTSTRTSFELTNLDFSSHVTPNDDASLDTFGSANASKPVAA